MRMQLASLTALLIGCGAPVGAESPADVIFLQESGYLAALSANDLLEKLPGRLLRQVDPRFRDKQGHWVGTSGRARVLVYDTKALAASELPATLEGLADPKWKGRLGWAPTNNSLQAHLSALRHLWGEQRTRAWLEALMKNEPVAYPKNAPQVKAAADGEISIGWVSHYYLYRFWKPGYTAANYSFPTPGDAGNVLMVAGAAVRQGTEHREAALKFIDYLVGEDAQHAFAMEGYEYPTRPGVATHPDLPPLESLNLADVDQASLIDLAPTLELLRELGML